nr:MAK10-like protein [Tanacetum cinerariifolium]
MRFALRRYSLIQKTEFGICSMTRQNGVQELLPYELMMNTLTYLIIIKEDTSMKKILNNNKAAQIKAQEIRRNMPESAAGQAPTAGTNVVPLGSDTIQFMQNGCSFHRLQSEDPNQHLKDFLKLVDSLDLDVVNSERTRLFQFFLRNQPSNWLKRLPAGSIFTWEDLTTQEEKSIENNGATDKSMAELSRSDEQEPTKEADKTNEGERRTDDELAKGARENVINNEEEEPGGVSALGWLLEEIHVTLAHLEKKRTRLQLYTKSLEEIRIKTVETVSPTLAMKSELNQDGVRNITTASESPGLHKKTRLTNSQYNVSLMITYVEPSYNQNYDDNYYPHESLSIPCCDYCGGSHETFQCQPDNQNVDFSGSDQIQTPQYPDVNHPFPEISNEEIFQAKGDLMKSIQTFLERFNCISFEEKPQILFQTWETLFAIQCSQPEDSNELFQKLLKDLKELAEYDQSTSTDRPIFLNDNEDHPVQNKESPENSSEENVVSKTNQEPPQDSEIHQLIEECSIKVPEEQKQKMENTMFELVKICQEREFLCIHDDINDLIESALNSKLLLINSNSQHLDKQEQEVKNVVEQPAERGNRKPEHSLSMGYEHLSITPETESDEVTESNAENLLPIPSKCEVTLEDEIECDMPANDDCSPVFSTFSNPLFKDNDDLDSSDDESLPDEDVPAEEFKIYSNPLCDEDKISSDKLDLHCFNVGSDFVESLLNRDTFIDFSSKFDFSGELAHIKLEIPKSDFDFWYVFKYTYF